MIEHPIRHSQLEVSRCGGAVLALGTLCYAVAVVAYAQQTYRIDEYALMNMSTVNRWFAEPAHNNAERER
jgi:hypothetical protein